MRKVFVAISYGQGGVAVDSLLSGGGIDRLHSRIKALGADAPSPFGWHQYQEIADRIKKLPSDTRVAVGGASLGANMAPWIGASVGGRTIDFMFGIQPSLYGGKYPVTNNVKRALCIYNPIWFITMGFGAHWWPRSGGNLATAMTYQRTYAGHPGDNLDSVQNPIIAAVKKLQES